MAISKRIGFIAVCALLGCAAEAPDDGAASGALSLALSSQAGGVEYQLGNARFTIDGPVRMDLSGDDQASMKVELPAGAYNLSLLDGYVLTDEGGAPVAARLVSANPAPVLISPGETAQLTLRFELLEAPVDTGAGNLGIDLSVAPSSAGAACDGLRINEIDYDQLGADDAEFIELRNVLSCAAPLASLMLELVNGGDGKVYARYDLSQVAESLPAGGRLVIGDEAVLARLPGDTARLMLNGSGLQNGPDGVRLVRGDQVLDAMSYEGAFGEFGPGSAQADEGEPALGRCPDGFDSGADDVDFRLAAPTPGAPNAC